MMQRAKYTAAQHGTYTLVPCNPYGKVLKLHLPYVKAHKWENFPPCCCRSLYTNTIQNTYTYILWVLPTTSCHFKGHVPFKKLLQCTRYLLDICGKLATQNADSIQTSIPSPRLKLELTPFPSRSPRGHFNLPLALVLGPAYRMAHCA